MMKRVQVDDWHNSLTLRSVVSSSEHAISADDYLPDNVEVMTPILDGLRRLGPPARSPGARTTITAFYSHAHLLRIRTQVLRMRAKYQIPILLFFFFLLF
jgi:hypothetical protein